LKIFELLLLLSNRRFIILEIADGESAIRSVLFECVKEGALLFPTLLRELLFDLLEDCYAVQVEVLVRSQLPVKMRLRQALQRQVNKH
jgi:hypothetical protein